MKKIRAAFKSYVYLLVIISLLFISHSIRKNKPNTYRVEIIQMQFQPALLKIHKGDTVIFINKDLVEHDVTEVNKAWHSPPLATNRSWKWVATKSADYYCSIHLIMKGQIIVD
jgi:plastocyanin